MKKAILLITLVFSSFFISCSDDDGGVDDVVVGRWQLQQTFANDVSQDILNCSKRSTIEFSGSLDFTSMPYEKVLNDGELECKRKKDISAKWKNLGDNKYELKGDGSVAGEINGTEVVELLVEGNTLIINSSLDDGGKDSIYKQIYKRI